MTSIDIGPTMTPTLQWEDIDGEGDVLFLRRGDRMVGEVYPRGEGYRWHCRVSDRREMAVDIDAAQKALLRCVQNALRLENGAELDEFLHHLMVEADCPGRERVYALLSAASLYLRPGTEQDADAALVADPSRVATELVAISSLEEAKTSQRDDALVTDLREVASLLWSRIRRQPASPDTSDPSSSEDVSASHVDPAHEDADPSPDPMDRWTISGLNTWTSPKGNPAFRVTLLLDGVPVLEAVNQGYGGCHDYERFAGSPGDILATLEADARAWVAHHGGNITFEIADAWVWWSVRKRPGGVMAAVYLAEF